MSNLDLDPPETVCGGATAAAAPVRELLTGHSVALGGPRGMTVTRTLPNRERRMVGAWCFLDYYGPDDLTARPGMRVPPHPHTGLQTVSWLFAGEVRHRDSLGNDQLIRPGQLNLMTAGHAIAHAEETPTRHLRVQHPWVGTPVLHPPVLHGVQLWTALPDRYRRVDPHFEHHADLPAREGAGTVTTFFLGGPSPARTYSPLVGAEVALTAGADDRLPLEPEFEYAALAVAGTVTVDGVELAAGPLLYLGTGRRDLAVRAAGPGRLLLLGGEPFEERLVMWWNFVGRDHDEIVADREEWMSGTRFGVVRGYEGDPLPAPPMPATRLKPRGRTR